MRWLGYDDFCLNNIPDDFLREGIKI